MGQDDPQICQPDTNQSQPDFHGRNMNFDQTKRYMKFTGSQLRSNHEKHYLTEH